MECYVVLNHLNGVVIKWGSSKLSSSKGSSSLWSSS